MGARRCRSHQGHWRAWVYAFEWPFFGVVALYAYRRFMRGDMPQILRPELKAFAALDSHEKEIIKEREQEPSLLLFRNLKGEQNVISRNGFREHLNCN